MFLRLPKIPQPSDMTYNLQFMRPLPPSAPPAKLCDFYSLFSPPSFLATARTLKRFSSRKLHVDFISFARTRAHSLCDFVISFPALLSLRPLSLSGSGAKVGRQSERRHGPEPPLEPQPLLKKRGCRWATTLSRSLAGEREGCGNSLLSHF